MNEVILLGRIGQKPELKQTGPGLAYLGFSIAISEYKGKDELGNSKYDTVWVNCTAFQKTAELIAKYTDKGHRVLIRGRLSVSEYEKDGVKRKDIKVIVDNAEFIEKKEEQAGKPPIVPGKESKPVTNNQIVGIEDDDSLPF